jgi:IS5 family transposase
VRQGSGWLYYFSTKDCMGCKFKESCLIDGEKRKRVFQSDCERLRKKIDKEDFKQRFVVERNFAHAKKWHDLGRARYRGRWRVGVQALMVFFVMNAEIIIRQISQVPL